MGSIPAGHRIRPVVVAFCPWLSFSHSEAILGNRGPGLSRIQPKAKVRLKAQTLPGVQAKGQAQAQALARPGPLRAPSTSVECVDDCCESDAHGDVHHRSPRRPQHHLHVVLENVAKGNPGAAPDGGPDERV